MFLDREIDEDRVNETVSLTFTLEQNLIAQSLVQLRIKRIRIYKLNYRKQTHDDVPVQSVEEAGVEAKFSGQGRSHSVGEVGSVPITNKNFEMLVFKH